MTAEEEFELVRRWQDQGDMAARDKLANEVYQRYSPATETGASRPTPLGHLLFTLGTEASDVFQEAWSAFAQKMAEGKFRVDPAKPETAPAKPSTFFARILRNKALVRRRAQRRRRDRYRRFINDPEQVATPQADRRAANYELLHSCVRVARCLPDEPENLERTIFCRRHGIRLRPDGFALVEPASLRSIARDLGRSYDWVKNRYDRAYQQVMRKCGGRNENAGGID